MQTPSDGFAPVHARLHIVVRIAAMTNVPKMNGTTVAHRPISLKLDERFAGHHTRPNLVPMLQ